VSWHPTLTGVSSSRSGGVLAAFFLSPLLSVLLHADAHAALGDCGQPLSNGSKPNATDCLHVLKAAVGVTSCDCVCDTNGSGTLLASDALLCLRVAVGQPLELECDCPALTISPTVTIEVAAGEERGTCLYFRNDNEALAVTRWSSTMSAAVHAAVLFLTTDANGNAVEKKPAGTVSSEDCGVGNVVGVRDSWTYAAYDASDSMSLPQDDGNGIPVAMPVPADAAGYVLLHLLNASDDPVEISFDIRADGLPEGDDYTPTATYLAYNGAINIPPMATNDVETKSCDTPDALFWRLSTFTHKQAIATEIRDGTTVLFESNDWEDPGAEERLMEPFLDFSSGKLTWECRYANPSTRTITAGDSFQLDEQCIAIGYFFPAEASKLCFNGFVVY
jgi:hypothetical protein